MGSGGVSLKDIFEKVTNNPEDVSSKTLLNVSTSTYYRNPGIYTLLNAVILSKLGVNQVILLGRLSPEREIKNWKRFLEELTRKTSLIVKFGDEEREFNQEGDIVYAEFPAVKSENLIDILTKEGEKIGNPFVWEDNGIKGGKGSW